MATVTQREPGVWLARVFLPPDGEGSKRRQVGKVFKGSKRAVKAAIAEWEADVRGTTPAAASATVADVLRLWQEAKAGEWQPTTARDRRSCCEAIKRDLGRIRLRDLDPLRIDKWVTHMRRRGVGDGAIRGRALALRAAMSWAVSRRMIRSNPVKEASPRLPARRRSVRPEPEQVVAILAAAKEASARAALALRLAAVTGAREAEIVALRWEDLYGVRLRVGRQRHTIDGVVTVRETTKGGDERTVILDPGTVAAIKAWKAEVDEIVGAETTWMLGLPGAAVPPSPRWLYDAFVRAATRAGIPTGRLKGIVLHDLRHWAASTALRDGHDAVTVAARLGHSPDTLLRVYAQEIEEGQVGVAASLAARLDS
ncbi:MAG: tyrosine-type recombinase/integrase [Acidimicrobiales bacterium]